MIHPMIRATPPPHAVPLPIVPTGARAPIVVPSTAPMTMTILGGRGGYGQRGGRAPYGYGGANDDAYGPAGDDDDDEW